MHTRFEATGSLSALEQALFSLEALPEVHGLLVLTCDANDFCAAHLDPILHRLGKPVCGGIFPGIIFGSAHFERGSIVVGLPARPDIRHIGELSDPTQDVEEAVAALADLGNGQGTLLIFVDGLAGRIGDLINALFEQLGLGVNQIGGGTGSLSPPRKPSVISNGGLLQDTAQVIHLDIESSLAMAHGWSIVSESMKVTAAKQNTIHSLNYRPALDVYREKIAAHAGVSPDQENFSATAKAYPFGIFKLGSEVVARDPVTVSDDGNLTCIGELPAGSFIHLLHGEPAALIAAAGQAAREAECGGKSGKIRLFIDCISRVHFLAERFAEELAAVQGDEPMIGILALGEICNNGRDYPEFFNKTAVIGLLGTA